MKKEETLQRNARKHAGRYQCINEAAGAEKLADFVAGELKGQELAAFKLHLVACHHCEEMVEHVRRFFELAQESLAR